MSLLRGDRRTSLLAALFTLTLLTLASQPAVAVSVWQRWDQPLQVGFDYFNGGGNPYRDLSLSVQFSGPVANKNFSGYAFWDGGNIFRVRAAFPLPGAWTWHVVSCSGLSGKNAQGQILPCGSDSTLMAQTGQVSVTPTDRPDNLLYSKGFLKVSGRYLTFTDDTSRRFYWQGDTAWAAISDEGQVRLSQPNRIPGQVTPTWQAYVDDRTSRGFTVLQVAPAVAWIDPNPHDAFKQGCPNSKELEWMTLALNLPGPETFAFTQGLPPTGQTCTGAVPNNCSRWRTDYWQEVDSMVEYANQKGLVVVMAGMIDPADRGGCRVSQSYPRTADAVIFARNLAARLAGNHVIFSPGFDDWPGIVLDSSAQSAGTVDASMQAVGPALKAVVPRHLVTNHLAGSALVTAYTNYQGAPWLDFQLFQSGHATNVPVACPGKSGSSWQVMQQCAVSRAIDLTKGLRAASRTMPVINGEGAYENPDSSAFPPDNRYGMRHTAYASLLDGAAGFTAGVYGAAASLTAWNNPASVFATNGIKDMQQTRTLFEGFFPGGTVSWGELASTTALIDSTSAGTNSSTAPGERRILSGAQGAVILSYVPNNPQVTTLGSLKFNCRTWNAEWRDPRGVQAPIVPCPGGTKTNFSIPFGCPNRTLGDQTGACDWLLYMRRPTSASGTVATGQGDTYLEVTVVVPGGGDSTDGIQSTGLTAQVMTGDGTAISPATAIGVDGTTQYGDPTVVSEGQTGAEFWVVWEAETTDDGTTDVFARLVGADGSPIGDAFQVNQWIPDSQFDPFTVIDNAGNVTVIWTSLGQDGDQGGIFARKFQLSGSPQGDEFQVNVTTAGDQAGARAGTDSTGNVVIAWRSGDGAVIARIYSVTGAPTTGEIAVNSVTRGREELIALEVDPVGSFRAHWESYSPADELLGRWVRSFDATGTAQGAETAETLP
jgi:hypothetical protein